MPSALFATTLHSRSYIFTPQYNYTVLILFCMGGYITIHFTLLIIFADLLL